jgi:hypothetical protein
MDVRTPFRDQQFSQAWGAEIGALDAPDVISAGSHLRVSLIGLAGGYVLPATVFRG